jgi:chromosome segregation ATPase
VRSNDYSRQSRLSDLKARIDAGRARLNMLKSQLQPVTDELGSLNARIETIASELKSLDRQHSAGLRIDIDDYNKKVDTYNGLLSEHRALIAANSSDFQLYEELARQDKDLVAQHNALLR